MTINCSQCGQSVTQFITFVHPQAGQMRVCWRCEDLEIIQTSMREAKIAADKSVETIVLRDRLAERAMHAILIGNATRAQNPEVSEIARVAYAMADEMLLQR